MKYLMANGLMGWVSTLVDGRTQELRDLIGIAGEHRSGYKTGM